MGLHALVSPLTSALMMRSLCQSTYPPHTLQTTKTMTCGKTGLNRTYSVIFWPQVKVELHSIKQQLIVRSGVTEVEVYKPESLLEPPPTVDQGCAADSIDFINELLDQYHFLYNAGTAADFDEAEWGKLIGRCLVFYLLTLAPSNLDGLWRSHGRGRPLDSEVSLGTGTASSRQTVSW